MILKLYELHLVIDWTMYFDIKYLSDKIKEYNLELVKIHKSKPLKNKKKIMFKFYGKKIIDFRGETSFNIYLIKDNNPKYEKRNTSKGKRIVNSKLFDLKSELRKITGGFKIHGTDNIQETKDNLRVLNLYKKYYKRKKFNDLSDVFNTLEKCKDLNWMVLRNFEEMPNQINLDEHKDVDLLVNDYFLVKRILDADSATKSRYEDGKNRVLNYVKINNKEVLFDFRFLGDNYYDINFQKSLLNNKKKKGNFYTPNEKNHLYSLIYHSIVHKKSISNTYRNIFLKKGINEKDINRKFLKKKLDNFMKENNYKYVKPEPSVGYYIK